MQGLPIKFVISILPKFRKIKKKPTRKTSKKSHYRPSHIDHLLREFSVEYLCPGHPIREDLCARIVMTSCTRRHIQAVPSSKIHRSGGGAKGSVTRYRKVSRRFVNGRGLHRTHMKSADKSMTNFSFCSGVLYSISMTYWRVAESLASGATRDTSQHPKNMQELNRRDAINTDQADLGNTTQRTSWWLVYKWKKI